MPGEDRTNLSLKKSFVTFHESSFREEDAEVRGHGEPTLLPGSRLWVVGIQRTGSYVTPMAGRENYCDG